MKINTLLLGALLGLAIMVTIFFTFRHVVNPYYNIKIPKIVYDSTLRKHIFDDDKLGVRTAQLNLEEKVASLNKRVDDVLIFGGIIITLLLAINIGVYVKTESEVQKLFNANFADSMKRIESYEARAGELLGKITAHAASLETRSQSQAPQTTENADSESPTNG